MNGKIVAGYVGAVLVTIIVYEVVIDARDGDYASFVAGFGVALVVYVLGRWMDHISDREQAS